MPFIKSGSGEGKTIEVFKDGTVVKMGSKVECLVCHKPFVVNSMHQMFKRVCDDCFTPQSR